MPTDTSIFRHPDSDELINVDPRWAAPRGSQSAGAARPVILRSSTCEVFSIIGATSSPRDNLRPIAPPITL
jgi:hypothetical protein